MIPVFRVNIEDGLSAHARKFLTKRQATAGALEQAAVDMAWNSFRRTVAGREVAAALSRCFHGKCAYCEQEAAKDVEHFYPKSRYRERMFIWINLLWTCKNCNTEKLALFPLDEQGKAMLLNPTEDDPLDFLCWDEMSGKIVPNPDVPRGRRAILTRDLLGLDQFSLAEESRNKLDNVIYLLARVLEEDPVRPETVKRLQDELAPHRPWLGIVRQLFLRPNPRYGPLVHAARKKLP